MLAPTEAEALSVYDAYGERRETDECPMWVDPFFSWVASRIPKEKPRMILDMGCGHGRFVPLLPQIGVEREEYIGLDFSPKQIEHARESHPHHSFEVCSIYDVGEKYPNHFQGFVCIAMLMHIPRKRIKEALISLRRSLKKGAIGFFSTPLGDGEGRTSTGVTLTLFEELELREIFKETGFYSGDFMVYEEPGMIVGWVQAE
jgi:SAM-dependent methyltransferase